MRVQELEEVPMTIVGGFDVHRAQITYDYLVTERGEVSTGQIAPANRLVLRKWLRRFDGEDVAFAVEGCTGWRYVAEELRRAGHAVHVAEPAHTRMLAGKKRRAKTDRADARHLRLLLMQDRLPESWVPPTHVLEIRAKARLYVALMDERRAWQQRIQAQLFHQGAPALGRNVLSGDGRERLAKARLSPAGRQIVDIALSAADHLTGLVDPLREELMAFAPRQPGCRALMAIYGIGALTAPIVWAELGDTRRFSSSEKAVRYTGFDITVWSSDGKRRGQGHLSRQGPPALRWALFEAAYLAARTSSPDHAYYLEVRARQGANRAALSVARKLARRAHHILRELGDSA
jgi:transposase